MTGNELDPLVGMNDPTKPLRSRLLAVPSLRARYLEHVRALANKSLSWEHLGPLVAQYRQLLADEIKADTRKLTSYVAFEAATADEAPAAPAAGAGGAGGGGARPPRSLRVFADGRSKFLLAYKEKPPAPPAEADSAAPREDRP